MKIAIAIIGAATIIAGGQFVQSDPGRTNPTTDMTERTGENRGLWGACCLEDGSCVMELATLCFSSWGGTFMGGECADNPCPDPIGACCNNMMGPDGTCDLFTEAECESYSGYWQGGATDCETAECEMEPPGSCCLPYGGCEIMSMWECDQEYMDDGGMAGDNWQPYTTCEEADCAPTCDPAGFFDNVAYPLTISCQDGPTAWPYMPGAPGGGLYDYIKIDLNNDGTAETVMQKPYFDSMDSSSSNKGRVLIGGAKIGTVEMLDIINIDPDVLTYTDAEYDEMTAFSLLDFIDVTGDGLADAIIQVGWCDSAGGPPPVECNIYYVTNISTPSGVACETDVNNDGNTDTNDILALIAGWGPCTP